MGSDTHRAASATAFPLAFGVCCVGVALFSVMDAAMKGLSLSIGLFNALFWRAMAGSLLGLALMLLTRQRWPHLTVLRLHMLRGTVVAVMASLFFWAIMRMPLAEAIALSFIAPLIALSRRPVAQGTDRAAGHWGVSAGTDRRCRHPVRANAGRL